ncbi:MAG: NAD(P)H-hydrate dehydratase [Phycisphaerae bacterium]|nr:NAD(P)H-hydrate dehydratase [Phycisphaerae bacterium]
MTEGEPIEQPTLPPRDADGHKGTFGTVVVVGGCAAREATMLGAPTLTARAALRAGAGLAKLALPAPLLLPALELLPSATAVGLPVDVHDRVVPHLAAETLDDALASADAVVIGPGLGPTDHAGPAVESMTLRVLSQREIPVVVDADALNVLASMTGFSREIQASSIFTPHPGEFARLAKPLNITHDPKDPATRSTACEAMAQRLGVVCVLKGSKTVVSDGQRTWTCDRGHACLATGGTGDVLGGVIASLVAQFVAPGPQMIGSIKMPKPPGKPLDLFDAARLGVLAHAIAGENWATSHDASAGLLATELTDELPAALESLRAK